MPKAFLSTVGKESEKPDNPLVEDIVVFFSGNNRILPLGFDSLTLPFDEDKVFPTSSMCAPS